MTEPVTFTTWDALIATFRARRIAIGLSQLDVDEIAGIASGYTGKLEASLTNPNAKNARSIGRESLPLMLGALGLEIAAMPAASTNKKSRANVKAYDDDAMGRGRKFRADRARKGGQARAQRMTEAQRRQSARKAARARWAKHRKEKAATKRTRQTTEVV